MRNKLLKLKFQFENRKIYKKIDYYEKLFDETQYWSTNDILELQYQYLKKLLTFTVSNVPYYRKLFKKKRIDLSDIKSVTDLSKIPVLTKQQISDNLNDLKAKNLSSDRFIKNSTSGYSGRNFKFFTDPDSFAVKLALILRKYNWMDSSYFDKELCIWGASWDLEQNLIYSKLKRFFNIENKINCSGYNLSEKDIIEIYKLLNKTNPKIIKSYPSILTTICDVFNKHNISYNPEVIHIGGEKLYNYQREKIEKTFNTKVYDYYAARDMPNIAQNCNKFKGLHLFMENIIFEVLDENNNPIEEGEGDIALTNLHNFSFPMIRYKIGDRARISKKSECCCGRNLKIVDEIIGRTFDIITFPNGNKVGGSFWTLLMRSVYGIKDFQVFQKSINHIQINYTLDNLNANHIDLKILNQRIIEYAGNDIIIKFNKVKNIPTTSAGKMKFIYSYQN